MNKTLLYTCATCVTFEGSLNNPYICLGLWEKKAQTYTHGLDENRTEKSVFHKPRQIPICRVAIEPRDSDISLSHDRC